MADFLIAMALAGIVIWGLKQRPAAIMYFALTVFWIVVVAWLIKAIS